MRGRDIRLIMAVDDDPVSGLILVSLFRVVHLDELDRSYRSIAHRLYRNMQESLAGTLPIRIKRSGQMKYGLSSGNARCRLTTRLPRIALV